MEYKVVGAGDYMHVIQIVRDAIPDDAQEIKAFAERAGLSYAFMHNFKRHNGAGTETRPNAIQKMIDALGLDLEFALVAPKRAA